MLPHVGGYFLLHDIAPDLGLPGVVVLLMAFGGILSYPLTWIQGRWMTPEERSAMPRVPVIRITIAAVVLTGLQWLLLVSSRDVATIPQMIAMFFMWMGFPFALPFIFLGDEPAMGVGDAIAWVGILTTVWRLTPPIRRLLRGKASVVSPPLGPASEARSAKDACDRCRAAAALPVTAEPLVRKAHSSEGPRFLYRCSACHSYWLKELTGIGVVSVVRVRQLFPNAVD